MGGRKVKPKKKQRSMKQFVSINGILKIIFSKMQYIWVKNIGTGIHTLCSLADLEQCSLHVRTVRANFGDA